MQPVQVESEGVTDADVAHGRGKVRVEGERVTLRVRTKSGQCEEHTFVLPQLPAQPRPGAGVGAANPPAGEAS